MISLEARNSNLTTVDYWKITVRSRRQRTFNFSTKIHFALEFPFFPFLHSPVENRQAAPSLARKSVSNWRIGRFSNLIFHSTFRTDENLLINCPRGKRHLN